MNPWAFPTTREVFSGPSVSLRWKMNAPASDCATDWCALEPAMCGCWMYKERSSQGGDGFLLGTGETKARRITASVASRTAAQNMILGSIIHALELEVVAWAVGGILCLLRGHLIQFPLLIRPTNPQWEFLNQTNTIQVCDAPQRSQL